jgi:hypothetical protein
MEDVTDEVSLGRSPLGVKFATYGESLAIER